MSLFKSFFYPVYDVTTTPERVPEFSVIAALPAHRGKNLAYTPLSAFRQEKVYPALEPFRSLNPRFDLFSRAVLAAKLTAGWDVTFVDASRYRIEAVVAKPPFYDADVVIEVREETNGSSLHMRSLSRHGRRDYGANFRRIQDFRAMLK